MSPSADSVYNNLTLLSSATNTYDNFILSYSIDKAYNNLTLSSSIDNVYDNLIFLSGNGNVYDNLFMLSSIDVYMTYRLTKVFFLNAILFLPRSSVKGETSCRVLPRFATNDHLITEYYQV